MTTTKTTVSAKVDPEMKTKIKILAAQHELTISELTIKALEGLLVANGYQ